MKRFLIAGLMVLASTASACGSILVTASEIDGNVVFSTTGGTLSFNDLTQDPGGPISFTKGVDAASGIVAMGSLDSGTRYNGVFGSSNLGSSTGIAATSFIGDINNSFYIDGNDDSTGSLIVRSSYSPNFGDPLWIGASTMTFVGQTFETLELTEGTYRWHWGTYESIDSYTLQIGSAPEPTTFVIWGIGLVGTFFYCGRRNRVA